MMETHCHHIDGREPGIEHWDQERYLVDTLNIEALSYIFDNLNIFVKHRLTQVFQFFFNILRLLLEFLNLTTVAQ